jgi:site-specific DNA-cytosine methylase
MRKKYKALDCCCCIGGMSEGLHRAGYEQSAEHEELPECEKRR